MPVFGIPKQPLNPTLASGYAAYRRPTRTDRPGMGTDAAPRVTSVTAAPGQEDNPASAHAV
jgi:hypothetical protein